MPIPNGASWKAYVEALRDADRRYRRAEWHFSVLGESSSWLHTIDGVGALIRRPHWKQFDDEERHHLLGLVDDETGAWGLLGSMKAAGYAKQLFRGDNKDRADALARVHEALTRFREARGPDDSIATAVACLKAITKERGLAHGVATRLMACARPDIAISVNGASAQQLGRLSGLPATALQLGRPNQYGDLLRWVATQPWHLAPQPKQPLETRMWNARAALLDCLVWNQFPSD